MLVRSSPECWVAAVRQVLELEGSVLLWVAGTASQVATGKGLWVRQGLKAPRPRPPRSLGLETLSWKKLVYSLLAGGQGARFPASEEEGRREESSRACLERVSRTPRAGPLGSGFGPLQIQPSFQVFSRPGPACSRLSRARCGAPPSSCPPPPSQGPPRLAKFAELLCESRASQSAAELRRAQPCGRGQ